jgi:hypothetical protein
MLRAIALKHNPVAVRLRHALKAACIPAQLPHPVKSHIDTIDINFLTAAAFTNT